MLGKDEESVSDQMNDVLAQVSEVQNDISTICGSFYNNILHNM